MVGLIMPWAAGMLKSAPLPLITVGDVQAEFANTNTWSFSQNLNRTSRSGDTIIFVAGATDAGSDSAITCSASGFTTIVEDEYSTTSCSQAYFGHKTSSGGETSISSTVTIGGTSLTMNNWIGLCLTVDGTATATDTDSGAQSRTLNTAGAEFALIFIISYLSTPTYVSGGGDVQTLTTDYVNGTTSLLLIDYAPLGGAADLYTLSTGSGGRSASVAAAFTR